MAEGRIDVGGAVLDWVTEGRGLPAISIGSPTYYRRTYPAALLEQFEITHVSCRHWAASEDGFDVATVTRDLYAADVERVRQELGIERPFVFGHSIHGALALEYVRRYPAVAGVVPIAAPPVGSLTLAASGPEFWERDATPERKAQHEANQAARRVPAGMESSQDLVDTYVANGALYWYDPTYDASGLWEGVETNLPVFGQLMMAAYGEYEIEPLETPAFVALGRYDYVVPFPLWDDAKGAFSNVTLKVFDRSGHTPQLEEPDEFAQAVTAWARKLA